MQFFFYCRDKAGVGATRRALLKEHWAFMSRYVDAMIARGPTMSADGKAVTGSMHIVDLPDADAARVFAYNDPLAKGSVFEDIMVRRYLEAVRSRRASSLALWRRGESPGSRCPELMLGGRC